MTIDYLVEVIGEKSNPPSQTAISELEALIGGELPADYLDFLRRSNGGVAPPNIVETANDFVLDWILGIRPEEYLSIAEHHTDLKDILPNYVIPIIADPFGNYVCLNIKNENRGVTYFYDHEHTDDDLKKISDSFTQFVSLLNIVAPENA